MSKLTDERIDDLLSEWLYVAPGRTYEEHRPFARAIEAVVTEPLLQRIAELEQRNSDLHEDVQRFKEHALNEKSARLELERQLEGARRDAELYRQLRNGSNWPAVFASHDAPEPLRGEELDAAMQKGQS